VSTLILILINEINENQFKILLEVNLGYNSNSKVFINITIMVRHVLSTKPDVLYANSGSIILYFIFGKG